MDDPEQLESLLAHAQDVIAVVEADGTIRHLNAAAERTLGFRPSELVGENAFELVHPEERDAVAGAFEAVVDAPAGTTDRVEHRIRTADGDWVWFESAVSNRTDSALSGYVVSSRNVDDRKRAERNHERTRDLLVELSRNTDDVLWTFTADWERLLFINDAYEDIYGRSAERLRGDPTDFMNAVHPDDRERVESAMVCLSAGEAVDVEYRVNEDERFGRWVWVQARPVFEPDGSGGEAVARIVGFSRDVTDRRERERQLQVLDRVLRHNLDNDMNVVLGYARQAADGDVDTATAMERIVDRCESLLETADKEREIVELLGERPSTGSFAVEPPLREAIRRVRECHRLDVELACPTGVTVRAVPELSRAFEELLENAVVHADDPDSRVRIDATVDDATVTVRVSDEGPPIPDQETRVLTGEGAVEPLHHGSGLGLWLVHWIVRLSDGEVSFHVEDGGNVVEVALPRA